ncbi:podoplanin [Gasterosteus aculeatus]
MNVQLLLVLALVGPFCAFTHASPTEIPKDLDESDGAVADLGPAVTEASAMDLTVTPDPPATEPETSPEDVAATEGAATTEAAAATEAATATEAAASTEVVTGTALPSTALNTEDTVKTEAPAASTASPEPIVTEVDITDPSNTAEGEVQPTEAVTEKAVVVEEQSDEGMSSGQVVGVVIGALLAVVIAIAVVIAVVRRMGKYSP